MNYIAVDDEPFALEDLEEAILEAAPDCTLHCFTTPGAALKYAIEESVDTAQGWTQNDAGQWLYYENGKRVTGWKQTGGNRYYFYLDGTMAVNTRIDAMRSDRMGPGKKE